MKRTFVIDEGSVSMRLDRWIRNNVGKFPQSLIEKSIRNRNIKLNFKKTKSSTKLNLNDKITIYNFNFNPDLIKKKNKFIPSNQIIKSSEKLIIDNNEDFIVLNKSAGISVQGGTKSKKNLIDIFNKSKLFENSKPYSVHRLDKDTSGIFIIAKHRKSAQLLTSLFRLRKIHKTYIAICNGEIQTNINELKDNLIRYDNGKRIEERAITQIKVIDKNINSSLVEMKPVTGRKHQLRKQLFMLGHSIYGDQKYRSTLTKNLSKNLMLHSYKIKFMINDKKYSYKAELPDYFSKFIVNKRLKF